MADDRAAEGGFVASEGCAVDADGVGTAMDDGLDAAVIEKGDAAGVVEDVVAGMRVGVEHAADEGALEDEAPHGARPLGALASGAAQTSSKVRPRARVVVRTRALE